MRGQAVAVHPVALQAVAEGIGDHPRRPHDEPVVVGVALAVLRRQRPPQHVAVRRGVVLPAVVGEPGHAGVRVGVDPVALQALPVRGGHDPPGRRQEPVVVGEVDVAGRGVDVSAAGYVAIRGSVGPPASLGFR